MKKVVLFLAISFSFLLASAQTEATTPDGRKVILKPDGTWYFATTEKTIEKALNCDFRINEENEAAGTVKKYLKLEQIAQDKHEILKACLRNNNNKISLITIYTGNLGCVTQESTLMIRLLNGEVVRLYNSSSGNCDAGAEMSFELDAETIHKLSSSQFSRMRISGSDFFADLNPTISTYFIDRMKCIQ